MSLLSYVLVRVFLCSVQALSDSTAEKLADLLAWLAYDCLRIRRSVIVNNIRSVYPGISDRRVRCLAHAMWRSLVMLCFEVAQAPRRINRYSWRDYIELQQMEKLLGTLLQSESTILLSGHFGNFEIAGFAAGLFGFPSFTIARPLDNRYLNGYFNRFRGMYGQFILPKVGIANQVTELLQSGATLTVLGDQAAMRRGIEMDFLGRPASCHKAIALFALTSESDLAVVTAVRKEHIMQFQLRCIEVLPTRSLPPSERTIKGVTQWYNDQLASEIMWRPNQYWWLHRRWKPMRRRRKRNNPELR